MQCIQPVSVFAWLLVAADVWRFPYTETPVSQSHCLSLLSLKSASLSKEHRNSLPLSKSHDRLPNPSFHRDTALVVH